MKPLATARAVFQESNEKRLFSRLSAIAGQDLGEREVKQLAGGDLSFIQQLNTPAQREVLALVNQKALSVEVKGEIEAIVGPTIDIIPIAFLDRARAAGRCVARVVDLDRRAIGTGVMVSPSLFLTNQHVMKSPEHAQSLLLQFDYALGVDDLPLEITEFRVDPGIFWISSLLTELDFTLVAVSRRVSGRHEPADFGYVGLRAGEDKHAIGDFVTLIEHPDGRYKEIALRENRVIGRGKSGTTLHYGADTLPGASGSPVFNDSLELVALHHAGGHINETNLEDGSPVPSESNEGIRISAIVNHLRKAAAGLSVPHRDLLLPALDHSVRGPSALTARTATEAAVTASRSIDASVDVASATTDDAGWLRTTIPLRIAIQVGEPDRITERPAPTVRIPAAMGTIERNEPPDPAYVGRRGYSDGFLRVDVPLPVLADADVAHAVQPLGNDDDDRVLRYLHFSAVHNGERRMPFFTAVNIDGRRSRGVNRQTGDVEAAETWYRDPRVPDAGQLDQSFYGSQHPRIFDRGHMVRRLDPAWGSKSVAKRASDDTFHFTNCCPQVSTFNQSAKIWQGIEDYVLQNARAADERVSVFTGPIFADDDPTYHDVAIPKAFWKIVVRVEGGTLRATGFIASQGDLLEKHLGAPEGFTSWDELGRVEVYQRRVADIAHATGLNFGDVTEHDTASGTEAVLTPVESLADVAW